MNLVQRLKQHFIDDGVEVNEPASEKEVESFQEKYNVKIPDDLKEYFLTFNGTGQGNFGGSGYAFFSLSEFELICETSDLASSEKEMYANCFALSDYMIWCWGYVIRLTPDLGKNDVLSIYLESSPNPKVANSFSEFIALYLDAPDDIIGST